MSGIFPAWSSQSAMRMSEFKQLFELISAGDAEATQTAYPFTKYSALRWLDRGEVMDSLLNN